jgi:hypothetical protein
VPDWNIDWTTGCNTLWDFLTTYHVRHPKGSAYGWVYVMAAALPLLGGCVVWLARHRAPAPSPAQRLRQRLNFGPAAAMALAVQDGVAWRMDIQLWCRQGVYDLELHRFHHWQSQHEHHRFDELDDLADHLERHTALRLSDLRTSASLGDWPKRS